MALSEVTTTFNLSDYIGADYDPRRTKVYLTTNAEKNRISDTSTGEIRLGGGTVTLGADGAVSATTWAPGVDANPASWQTTFHIDYVDSATRQRQTVAIGPFTITTSGLLTALELEQNVPATLIADADNVVAGRINDGTSKTKAALDGYVVANDLGTSDGQMTIIAENAASEFRAAENAQIVKAAKPTIDASVAAAADATPADHRVQPSTLALSPVLSGPGAGNSPGWLSRDRTTLFSVSGARHVRYSTDSGVTWLANGQPDFDAGVTCVRDMIDGEILVFTGNTTTVGKIWRSNGWTINKATATFTQVKAASAVGVYFHNGWSVSVHENIILAAEYGPKTAGANARYVYLSEDYGLTWKTVYTLTDAADYHMHGVAYDKWYKRIWVSWGDVQAGVDYSDDMGATWKSANNFTGAASLKCTTIVPMRDCVLFLSDTNPNGVWRARRTPRSERPILELAHKISAPSHITHLGFTAHRSTLPNSPWLLTFGMDSGGTGWTGPGLVIATTDGYTFHEIWRDELPMASGGIAAMVGPTIQGHYVGYSADTRQGAGYTMVKIAAPNWTVPDVRPRDWNRAGDETMPRLLATGDGALVSGRLHLAYLTATENVEVTSVLAYTSGTGAGATPTLCRWGLYEVQNDNSLKLVASTANNATLFSTAFASAGDTFTTPFAKSAGRKYAIGALCVTTAQVPTLAAATAAGSLKLPSGALFVEPRLSGRVDGLSDLPTTITAGSILSSGVVLWASLR